MLLQLIGIYTFPVFARNELVHQCSFQYSSIYLEHCELASPTVQHSHFPPNSTQPLLSSHTQIFLELDPPSGGVILRDWYVTHFTFGCKAHEVADPHSSPRRTEI